MDFSDIGLWIVDGILGLAGSLTGEGAPGWVSLVLFLAFIGCWIIYQRITKQFLDAIKDARSILKTDDRHFNQGYLIEIAKHFKNLEDRSDPHRYLGKAVATLYTFLRLGQPNPRRRLGTAWSEFEETCIYNQQDDPVQNTVRPFVFFSREDLGLEQGIWRQVPAWFVTVGLFLTFLGLVAALEQTSVILDRTTGDNLGTTEGLKTLLRVASAKFIMSLTGLLCSILFSVALRWNTQRIDRALHDLCADIERGCVYLSEQSLLTEALKEAKAQTCQLQSFSTELVAQIAKPLREELPQAIREAIQESIQPAIEGLQKGTGEGIQSLTEKVSDQFAESIKQSADSITAAVGTLNKGADRLQQQMNDALQALSDSTSAGARSMEQGSVGMAKAASAMAENIRQQTQIVAVANRNEIEAAGRTAVSGINEATTTMRQQITEPLETLAQRIDNLASRIKNAAKGVKGYTDQVVNSAGAVELTNKELTESAEILTAAIEPVRATVEGIETTTKEIGTQVKTASTAVQSSVAQMTQSTVNAVRGIETATKEIGAQMKTTAAAVKSDVQQMTGRTVDILRNTQQDIKASQTVVQQSLGALKSAIEEFNTIIQNSNDIDRKLGDALSKIEEAVKSTTEKIGDFTQKQNESFTEALNRLHEVIAEAEPFRPRRKD